MMHRVASQVNFKTVAGEITPLPNGRLKAFVFYKNKKALVP